MRITLRTLSVAFAILACWLVVPMRAFADVIDPTIVEEPSSSASLLLAPVVVVVAIAAFFILRRRKQ